MHWGRGARWALHSPQGDQSSSSAAGDPPFPTAMAKALVQPPNTLDIVLDLDTVVQQPPPCPLFRQPWYFLSLVLSNGIVTVGH